MMTTDALIAAARRIEREWGCSGYAVERVEQGPTWGAATLHVVHSDGSRFMVAADRYGNPLRSCERCSAPMTDHETGTPPRRIYSCTSAECGQTERA